MATKRKKPSRLDYITRALPGLEWYEARFKEARPGLPRPAPGGLALFTLPAVKESFRGLTVHVKAKKRPIRTDSVAEVLSAYTD